jgi:hypothetical protein
VLGADGELVLIATVDEVVIAVDVEDERFGTGGGEGDGFGTGNTQEVLERNGDHDSRFFY